MKKSNFGDSIIILCVILAVILPSAGNYFPREIRTMGTNGLSNYEYLHTRIGTNLLHRPAIQKSILMINIARIDFERIIYQHAKCCENKSSHNHSWTVFEIQENVGKSKTKNDQQRNQWWIHFKTPNNISFKKK